MSAGYALLRESSGFVLDDDKRYLLEDRLRPVLRDRGINGIDDLAQRLQNQHGSELADAVAQSLTINETSFFRDRSLFASLSGTLLPRLVAAREHKRQLRIWCAGCATGQEPYSLAMILDDMSRKLAGWQVEIVATDLSRAVIEVAKVGLYSQFEVQRGLPVMMMLRHFARVGEHWQISDAMRAKVVFRTGNLLAIPLEAEPFDMIFCRNVLFYFDAATRRRVLSRLVACLASDGLIALGGAERVNDAAPLVEAGAPFLFRHAGAASA